MVFKKLLGAIGVGGLSVDTVLSNPSTYPGAQLTGNVNLIGGTQDADIEHITLGLVTRMEVEGGGGDYSAVSDFLRIPVTGPMRLAQGQRLALPFRIDMPWETPITSVYGQTLRGMVMGVRTEVAIARAIDKGDLDPVHVHPLPLQQRILDAFHQLGFVFKSADLEHGQIYGVHQTLPFYQEIEFFPPQQFAAAGINEVELTFVTSPHQVEVVLEFDKRGGLFTQGHDTYGRYTVSHADAETTDWRQVVDGWVRQAVDRRKSMPGFGGGHGHPQPGYGGYGHPQPGYGHQGHHGHYRRSGHHGSGLGGMAMGVAGGLAAGYVAGEVFDEIGDAFEGGDE